MQFLKIHTAGSDFIVCDAADLPDARGCARLLNRRTGIGGEGLLTVGDAADNLAQARLFLRRPGQRHGGNDGGTGAARPRQMPLCHAH